MIVIPFAVFILIALAAIAFAAGPVLRQPQAKGRWLLIGAVALFLLGVGVGVYWIIGQPQLALRDAAPAQSRDLKGLLPLLVARVHAAPQDVTAWNYLGRAYMSLRDPGDAARAFGEAVTLLKARRQNDPELFSAYGEALVQQSGGAVTAEAEAAFTAALTGDPKDAAARFYLGLARAGRGDKGGALALWQSLAADVPPTAPLHQILVDRIALLTASGGTGMAAPDPMAMVAGLAARLKADPHDAQGWRRLIRAYHVLGDDDKAKEALATARQTFKADRETLIGFDQEAIELNMK